MNDSRWLGFAFDATIILSLTALAALRVVPVLVFVALIGPMIGSRLALRYLRDGAHAPDHSAIVSLALAVTTLFRR